MEHSYSFHLDCLNKLCRTCGERCFKAKVKGQKTFLCENFKKDLLLYYRINIDTDSTDGHPKQLCSKCAKKIYALRTKVSDARLASAAKCVEDSTSIWISFDAKLNTYECSVCKKFLKQSAGCIKQKPEAHTSDNTTGNTTICTELAQTTLARQSQEPTLTDIHPSPPLTEICKIFQCVFS